MFGRIGVPEVIVIMLTLVFWIVPLIAGVWALVTLYRIRLDQQTVMTKLDSIERRLLQ